jgi:DNA-binding GntR family transcriptional regulator
MPNAAVPAGKARTAGKTRKVRNTSIPAKIADSIRDLISRGTLAPEVHLGQLQLAQRFGVSRVPVREALKLLASEGLVLHDLNRGFFVASLSSDEARQLYRMRHLVEAELLTSIDWPNKEQLAELRAKVEEMEKLIEDGKRAEWAVRHREFHRAVFNLSSQKILIREVLRLWTLTDRYRSLLPAQTKSREARDGNSGERALVEALSKADRKRLLDVFEEDRTRVEEMLLGILEARGL